jgi:hypothetical protein
MLAGCAPARNALACAAIVGIGYLPKRMITITASGQQFFLFWRAT